MKTAITAVSGQLGRAIANRLITETGKDNLIGIARTPPKANDIGIEIRKADYNNRKDFDEALKGIECLLLISSMDHPQNRIPQHRNIIEAAKARGVKKIVYTSIVGDPEKNGFSPVVKSNRQTEEDIKKSGIDWVIGRNGLYIDPDLEYIDQYIADGAIINSAGDGLCTYTSRGELAEAYAHLLTQEVHNGKTYHLVGNPISQAQLAKYINDAFNTQLTYKAISVEDFRNNRIKDLGQLVGTIIGGIYEGIREGAFNLKSDFEKAAQRPHKSVPEMIEAYKQFRD
ncbi:SDR family oxidoreductase [Thermophagus sp. OGC60D27]|uniref:SDR family oxidoreductase n=1 Tax=Thermophagus sp. OGC60D27 TaxID=3458415 RepID=UPI0040378B24